MRLTPEFETIYRNWIKDGVSPVSGTALAAAFTEIDALRAALAVANEFCDFLGDSDNGPPPWMSEQYYAFEAALRKANAQAVDRPPVRCEGCNAMMTNILCSDCGECANSENGE